MRDAQVRRAPVVSDVGHLVGAISIDDLVLVAQNVRAGAEAASVVGFHAVGRAEWRSKAWAALSRFRDGVRSSVCDGPGRQRGAACGERPRDVRTLRSTAPGRRTFGSADPDCERVRPGCRPRLPSRAPVPIPAVRASPRYSRRPRRSSSEALRDRASAPTRRASPSGLRSCVRFALPVRGNARVDRRHLHVDAPFRGWQPDAYGPAPATRRRV